MPLSAYTVDETGLNTGMVTVAADAYSEGLVGAGQETKDEDVEEIERLRRKCGEYRNNEAHWRFLLRAYEGGPDYIGEDTLFKHPREAVVDYDERARRSHYQNYCAPLVDFVPEYIFSQDVERDAPEPLTQAYEAFKMDCDRAGTNLNAFMQEVGEDLRIFGKVYVQVDKPKRPDALKGQPMSVQQAKDLGVDLPYLILIRPLEVLDWRMDSRSNLMYLKRVEFTSLPGADQDYVDVERYTEWRGDDIKISVINVSDPKNPTLMERGVYAPNPIKFIPIVPIYFKRSKSNRDMGMSFLQDIAYQNRAVFNNTSLIDEFLYRQCFNILAMPSSGSLGGAFKSQVDGNMGTSNVLEMPEGATLKPEYITPPADPAAFIQSERANSVREMYRQAAQDVMAEVMTSDRSGDAQKQGFSRTIPVINKTADCLQYAERRIAFYWAKLQGKDWTGGKISYKDDYSITNLLDLLTQLTMIFDGVRLWSPTFIREEWKRVVREMDGKIDHDTIEKIFGEIDKLSDDKLHEIFTAPPLAANKATAGVPSTANVAQGKKQKLLGTDKRIGGATGSKAATKETNADANKRAKTSSKPKG